MMTKAMDCAGFNDRLMAYLEHETDEETRAAIERHSITCPECGALLADLRKLRLESANLPRLTPSRDLWSGIAARIEAPVVPIGTGRQSPQDRSGLARRIGRGALVAAALIAAAGIGYLAAARRIAAPTPGALVAQAPDTVRAAIVSPTTDSQVDASEPSRRQAALATSARATITNVVNAAPARSTEAQRAVATLNADYDREIARLRVLIDQRRNQLDPVTVAIIEKNLQVIDMAIAECKRAIARDPASRFLIESLNQSLQTKVELMRTAALLPSRT